GRLRFVLRADAACAEGSGCRDGWFRGPGTSSGYVFLRDQRRNACGQFDYWRIVEALWGGSSVLCYGSAGHDVGDAAGAAAGRAFAAKEGGNPVGASAIQLWLPSPDPPRGGQLYRMRSIQREACESKQ